MLKDNGVLVCPGKRPFLQWVMAAVFHIGGVYCVFRTILEILNLGEPESLKNAIVWFCFALTCFFVGFLVSAVRDYHFDLNAQKYRVAARIGPISMGKWADFVRLDYISVFERNPNRYRVILFYNWGKNFVLSEFRDKDDAMEMGRKLAKKMSIKLLDAATDRYNPVWIELEEDQFQ